MASLFTASSGLEKPGSGEQAGSWGETVNSNFDIIDRVSSGFNLILTGSSSTLQQQTEPPQMDTIKFYFAREL